MRNVPRVVARLALSLMLAFAMMPFAQEVSLASENDAIESGRQAEVAAGDEGIAEGAAADNAADAADARDDAQADASGEDADALDLVAATSGATEDYEAEMDEYAAAHEGDLADGCYLFVSRLSSSLVLDVNGASGANGANAIVWTKSERDNQRWVVESAGGGYVTIKSVSSGKVLDVYGRSNKAGAYVIQWSQKNDASRNQLWVISREADGSYKITSAQITENGTHLVLDVVGAKSKAGTKTCVYTDKANAPANQRWTAVVPTDLALDAEAAAHKNDLADGTYLVGSALGSSLVLDVKSSSKDAGAQVIVWTKKPATNQGWIVSHDSDGYVTFTNANSGKVLDVSGGTGKSGASIVQWNKKATGARNQKWIVSSEGTGYKITSALTQARLVLDVKGGKAEKGAQLIVWTDKGGSPANQRWTFEAAPEQYAYANTVSAGVYEVQSALDETKVLDVAHAYLNDGDPVILYTCNHKANQAWRLAVDNQGFCTLTNVNSSMDLSIDSSSGHTVQVDGRRKWIAEPAGDGCVLLRDPDSGKLLTALATQVSNGTEVGLAQRNGSDAQKWKLATALTSSDKVTGSTKIMGVSTTKQSQAVRYLKKVYQNNGWSLPSKWVKDGVTIESLVALFWEEGEIEGVRGDIALAQSLLETAYFQFGGDVVSEQYNFAGLGTTGGGVRGNYFGSARIGIRAQIQHLKAYASTATLKQACVDERFGLVSRGCAPTLSGLSGRWAVPGYSVVGGKKVYYHESIADIVNAMMVS